MSEAYTRNALPTGAMVQGYRIERVLGAGSFGIVYKARNVYFDEIVAVKEFLPSDLACRADGTRVVPLSSETEEPYGWALKQFLREAQILWQIARPERHPNIVRVSQFLEENGTAYMVMDYEEGKALSQVLDERGTLPEAELRPLLDPLLDGLERAHQLSVWHRDIKPANILVRSDGSPVLIDFGAARQDRPDRARSVMAMYSPAYAAPEQVLAMGEQGPWTDIYGLGATLYRAVTGKVPTGVSERALGVKHIAATEGAAGRYDPGFLAAIDAALALTPTERPQSIAEWRRLLNPRSAPADTGAADRTVIRPAAREAPLAAAAAKALDDLEPASILPSEILPAATAQTPPAAGAGARAPRRRAWVWGLASVAVLAGLGFVGLRLLAPGPIKSATSAPPTTAGPGDRVAAGPGPGAVLPPAPAMEPPSTEAIIDQLSGRSRPPAETPPAPPAAPTAGASEPPAPVVTALATAPPADRPAARVETVPSAPPTVEPARPREEPAPPPAVAAVAPRPVAPAAVASTTLAAEVDKVLAGFECAGLSSTVSPDRRVFVSGYVSSAGDLGALKSRLEAVADVKDVVPRVDVYERPFCEVAGLLRPFDPSDREPARAATITLNKSSRSYKEGEFMVVQVTASRAFKGYLYVDYLDSAGSFVHMLPSPDRKKNAVGAGERVVLGTADGQSDARARQYEIVPPHGRGMVFAVFSRRPLFDRPRPEVETADQYLPALAAGLKRVEEQGHTEDAVAASVFLVTHP